jgi:hypothetical protein
LAASIRAQQIADDDRSVDQRPEDSSWCNDAAVAPGNPTPAAEAAVAADDVTDWDAPP